MKLLQALLLQLACVGLVHSASNLFRFDFSSNKDEAGAGEAVTFRVQARFNPDYPATLVNDEVELNFIGLTEFDYNRDEASTYVQCNLRETTTGSYILINVEITDFEVGKEMDCNITMRMSSSVEPGSIHNQNLVVQWKEIPADGSGSAKSGQMEWSYEISIPRLLRFDFSSDRDEVEAGESVTFRVQARFTPNYPAILFNNEVELNFTGLSGLAYNRDEASTYVQCNLMETTEGTSRLMHVKITEFEVGKEMDCNITMRMSSSLRPGSIFRQNLFVHWKEIPADGSGTAESQQIERNNELSIPRVKISMALNDADFDKFYNCGPPFIGLDIILDFPKSDLSVLTLELRWPLGGRGYDPVEVVRIPVTDIGEVKVASGVTAGPLTARQDPEDITAGFFNLTNVQASGQSINSHEDIIIETSLEVVEEFKSMRSDYITIRATLTHPAVSDVHPVELSYNSELTFEIMWKEYQRWDCDNGGKTVQSRIWIAITLVLTFLY